jgi:hypothetical protein
MVIEAVDRLKTVPPVFIEAVDRHPEYSTP